jgi:hypothetical protein
MSARFFHVWLSPQPSPAQINKAIDEYERQAAHGFSVNEIARRMQVTPGTACVIRRWSLERAAGQEVQP